MLLSTLGLAIPPCRSLMWKKSISQPAFWHRLRYETFWAQRTWVRSWQTVRKSARPCRFVWRTCYTKLQLRSMLSSKKVTDHFFRAANNGRSTDNVRPVIADLTGQTPVLPVILTGHFWIQTLYFPYNCRLMLYNAAMISFFFGVFCCFALNPSKKKNAAIN